MARAPAESLRDLWSATAISQAAGYLQAELAWGDATRRRPGAKTLRRRPPTPLGQKDAAPCAAAFRFPARREREGENPSDNSRTARHQEWARQSSLAHRASRNLASA